MSRLKCEKLFYRFEPEYLTVTVDGKEIEDKSPQAYFRGACQIPGSQFNIGFGLVSRPGIIDPYPHRHFADEYLIFGSATLNAKDWDAHIELTIGIGDDAETYSIDEPTTVRIPAGIWHCPLNFVRVGKPVFFQPALLQGMFGGVYLIDGVEKEMYYNGQIQCVLDSSKKCNVCKQCLELDWRE
ncbi:MAG: hypothetical protein QM368_06815 [Bacillota bacterium]|nr:hypothetical protein [Bacillota bacterium]HHU30579.1 hypothetical protein [Bacillota bacterium]